MSSLPNPMFDAALPTGEIPAVAMYSPFGDDAVGRDRWLLPNELRAPVGLQAMTLPNGRWLLVLDNVSEVDALGLDRDRLSERSGAADVLIFVGSVQVTEAYPEQVLERDKRLVDELGTREELALELEKTQAQLRAARARLSELNEKAA